MKKKSNKLSVSKATIANLGENEVREINGGKKLPDTFGGGASAMVCSVAHTCYQCDGGGFTVVAI
jgi:hypothetical protein